MVLDQVKQRVTSALALVQSHNLSHYMSHIVTHSATQYVTHCHTICVTHSPLTCPVTQSSDHVGVVVVDQVKQRVTSALALVQGGAGDHLQ